MAKTAYKIPASLARSTLDHEITVSAGGVSGRALPVKVILFYLLSGLFTGWFVTNTPMQSAPLILQVLFVIWSIIAIVIFGKFNKTKEMRFMQLGPLLGYLPKNSRRVLTRSTSDPNPFYAIARLRDVESDGLIHFVDGTVGRAFLVAGSASVLLFDEDQHQILDRVDSFWCKIGTDVEFINITTKEPQRIYHQIANLKRRRDNLFAEDPELLDLMDEQFDVLNDIVGRDIKSIHQYVVIKADHREGLRAALNVFGSETESSPLMFKSCVQLGREDTLEMLKVFYQGRPNITAKELRRTEGLVH